MRASLSILLLHLASLSAVAQEAWEKRCLAKILKNYSGPDINDKNNPVCIDFTVFPDGTAKWPHCAYRPIFRPQKRELSSVQREITDALKQAVLKASPLEKYPSEYLANRGVASICQSEGKTHFWLIDFAGTWTDSIYPSTKPADWPEVLNPITKNFVAPHHKKEVHACIFLVLAPDGKPIDITPTRCTRIKTGIKESYAEIRQAQQALVSAVRKCKPFSVAQLYGDEPKPVAAYLMYRSYQKPELRLYTALYGRCSDYIDLYEDGQTAPKIENQAPMSKTQDQN